jgi:hypothetical protein
MRLPCHWSFAAAEGSGVDSGGGMGMVKAVQTLSSIGEYWRQYDLPI